MVAGIVIGFLLAYSIVTTAVAAKSLKEYRRMDDEMRLFIEYNNHKKQNHNQ